jgi:L-lactate dehydrogenase
MTAKRKTAVIGSGAVGATTAFALASSGLVSEIALIDANRGKAEGDALDISHGASFLSPVKITAGGYEETRDADIVIITAGASQKPDETRMDLLKRNAAVFRGITDELVKNVNDGAIIIVVTNPVDVLTYLTIKRTGFDSRRIIGSGTVLDTSRLKFLISRQVGVDARNVHTYVIGEHGDTESVAWSLTTIAGLPFGDYCALCGGCEQGERACRDRLFNETKNAAYEIINKKGATFYAVALAVKRIVEAIIGDENSILTVSSLFGGQYGISGVCASVPTIVNKNGADRILEAPLSGGEAAALRRSADTLLELIKEAEAAP